MNEDSYAQMQMLDYQLKQMQQIVENIDNQLIEIDHVKNALVSFETLAGNEEAFFPLSNGIFVKGKLSKDKMLRINIGNNIVVEKTSAQAIDMMDKQLVELKKYKDDVLAQMDLFMNQMQQSGEGVSEDLHEHLE